MKKLALILLLILSVISCKKEEEYDDDMVVIKGKTGSESKNGENESATKGASLADAARVVVVTGVRYTVVDIVNNSFSTDAPMGGATALIFVDSENRYIGNLHVSGLNILPLVKLSDGANTVIDLSTLTLFGTSVIPANNPIGQEILINDDDIEFLKETGSYYEAISKNLDADNDGVLDIFTGKQLFVNTEYDVTAGVFGLNTAPPDIIDSTSLEIHYGLRVSGTKKILPANPQHTLSGPEGSPHDDIIPGGYYYGDACECFDASFGREGQIIGDSQLRPPFGKGIYTFSIDGINDFTLFYSSISAKYFFLLAVPRVMTTPEGIITRVLIDYMLPDGTPVDHTKFLTTLRLHFDDTPAQETIHWEGSIFDLTNPLPDFKNVELSKPVSLNSITDISILYTDLTGNIYAIRWTKPLN